MGRSWEDVIELHSVVTGSHAGRTSADQITLFKSHGIALWDVAVAGYVYQQAFGKRNGQESRLDLKWPSPRWERRSHYPYCLLALSPSSPILLAVISPLSARPPTTEIFAPIFRS